nr:uncharacterized protein LOC110562879 [Meriones unguiculatus]
MGEREGVGHPAALPGPCPPSPGGTSGRSRAVPAASFRARGAGAAEATRPAPRRAPSATRAALAAAGRKAHASGGSPRPASRGGGGRRDLARVKRLSPEPRVRATSQPDAPPSLPASRLPRAPPGRCGGRFPGTFQESASRDRSPRQRFKEARALMRRLQGSRLESRCGCRRLRGASLGLRPPPDPAPRGARGQEEHKQLTLMGKPDSKF